MGLQHGTSEGHDIELLQKLFSLLRSGLLTSMGGHEILVHALESIDHRVFEGVHELDALLLSKWLSFLAVDHNCFGWSDVVCGPLGFLLLPFGTEFVDSSQIFLVGLMLGEVVSESNFI